MTEQSLLFFSRVLLGRADSCMQENRVENSTAPKPEEGRGGGERDKFRRG